MKLTCVIHGLSTGNMITPRMDNPGHANRLSRKTDGFPQSAGV
jgi:hypothetical protein